MNNIQVDSEIAPLRQLLIHSPDGGIGNILTSKMKDWLHDDLVNVEKMQEEYDQYVTTLLLFLDPSVLFSNGKFDFDSIQFNPEKTDYIGYRTDKILDTQFLLARVFEEDYKENQGVNTLGLIEAVAAVEGLHTDRKHDLKQLYQQSENHKTFCMELAKTFITGKLKYEINDEVGEIQKLDEPNYIFPPIPNFIFTRDIGVSVNDYLLITKPRFKIRRRETLLLKFLTENYLLKSQPEKILEVSEDDDFFQIEEYNQDEYKVSFEGGDIMMISKNHLLIGGSERTSPYALSKLIQRMFRENTGITTISVVKIFPKRSQMHIDTVFTQVKKDLWMLFGPLSEEIEAQEKTKDYYFNSHLDHISQKTESDKEKERAVSILQFFKSGKYDKNKDYFVTEEKYETLKKEGFKYTKPIGLADLLRQISVHDFGVKTKEAVNIVYSGGGVSPHDEREQWTCSCNLLVLREGVAIGYDRNEQTLDAYAQTLIKLNGSEIPADKVDYIRFLESYRPEKKRRKKITERDYYVIQTDELIDYLKELGDQEKVLRFIENLKDALLVLPSNELSRTRGGSHCMSMPLVREKWGA